MENNNNNKRKIITIVLGAIALTLVIGVSYAVWRYTFTGQANTIETERIELELLESTDEIISLTNVLPISDNQGKSQTNTFNFAVTTRTASNTEIGYSLRIEKLSVDSGYTSLNDNQIKVYLTDYSNTSLLNPTLISALNSYVLYSKTNTHNSTTTEIQDKYKLRVWIDQDVSINDWNESTKLQYKFKIGVGEKQDQVSTSNSVYSWSTSDVYIGDALDSISEYTTDYTILGKNHFLKHNIGSNNTVESQELCYMLNSNLYCLKGGSVDYYEENVNTLYASFGEENCSVKSSYVYCSASGIYAKVYLDGDVDADVNGSICSVSSDGYAYCGWIG